eukprot:m.82950 g.82950  ORF g.82950 m.82950 type:complete len:343 (-) comp8143_c0_seq1:5116-6144(-)
MNTASVVVEDSGLVPLGRNVLRNGIRVVGGHAGGGVRGARGHGRPAAGLGARNGLLLALGRRSPQLLQLAPDLGELAGALGAAAGRRGVRDGRERDDLARVEIADDEAAEDLVLVVERERRQGLGQGRQGLGHRRRASGVKVLHSHGRQDLLDGMQLDGADAFLDGAVDLGQGDDALVRQVLDAHRGEGGRVVGLARTLLQRKGVLRAALVHVDKREAAADGRRQRVQWPVHTLTYPQRAGQVCLRGGQRLDAAVALAEVDERGRMLRAVRTVQLGDARSDNFILDARGLDAPLPCEILSQPCASDNRLLAIGAELGLGGLQGVAQSLFLHIRHTDRGARLR